MAHTFHLVNSRRFFRHRSLILGCQISDPTTYPLQNLFCLRQKRVGKNLSFSTIDLDINKTVSHAGVENPSIYIVSAYQLQLAGKVLFLFPVIYLKLWPSCHKNCPFCPQSTGRNIGTKRTVTLLGDTCPCHWVFGHAAAPQPLRRETHVMSKSVISQISKNWKWNEIKFSTVGYVWFVVVAGKLLNAFKHSQVPDILEYLVACRWTCRILIYRRCAIWLLSTGNLTNLNLISPVKLCLWSIIFCKSQRGKNIEGMNEGQNNMTGIIPDSIN